MKKKKFDTSLSLETISQINEQALKDGRTPAGMARKILEDYFKQPTQSTSSKTQVHTDNNSTKDMTAFFAERNKNK